MISFDVFLNRASKKHSNKFSYIESTWEGFEKSTSVVCPTHGQFNMIARQHIAQKHGCPQCAMNYSRVKAKERRLTHTEFLKRANTIHGDKYSYVSECTIASAYIDINCSTHGIFNQTAQAHLSGQGCPACGKEKAHLARRMSFATFVEKGRRRFNDKFTYLEDVWRGGDSPTSAICPSHGRIDIHPYSHVTKKHGCPSCAIEERNQKRRLTDHKVITDFRKMHGDKYDYSKMKYINSNTPVEIVCPTHGVFKQSPDKHKVGRGCAKCSNGKNTSKIAEEWLDFLKVPEREYRLPEKKRLVVDGYDSTTNTIYQFHGDFWHGNPSKFVRTDLNERTKVTYGESYDRTSRIENEIRSYGYNVVTIWETDWIKERKRLRDGL